MKKRVAGTIFLVVVFLVASVGISFAAGGTVAEGNLLVFKNGQLNRKLSGVNPVEEGPLLVCNGKCMIKSGGVSVLAEDKAELAIVNRDDTFRLFVRSGHVEFIISPQARKIAFYTPDGVYSVADVMFNSSTDPVVRGYMQVDDSGAKIGIREGRMIFATDKGAKSVKANQQIILAMADVNKPGVTAQAENEKKKKKKKAAGWWWWQGAGNAQRAAVIVAGIGVVGGGAYALTRDSGGGGNRGLPASPAK